MKKNSKRMPPGFRLAPMAAMVGGVGLISLAMPALAQQQEGRRVATLEEIVVTARKVSENVQDVPLAVTAFSGERLKDLSVVSIPDLQAVTPNLSIRQSAGDVTGAAVSLRGQRQPDILLNFDPAVGVYIDGVYLPRANGLNAAMVDVESVEVLRGPQGTLFGKNTTGGAINITTVQPELNENSGYLTLGAGNYNQRKTEGAINIPLVEDRAALRITGQTEKRDGYGRDFDGEHTSDYGSDTIRARLLWQLSDDVSLTIGGDHTTVNTTGTNPKVSWLQPYGGAAPSAIIAQATAELGLPFNPTGFQQAHDYLANVIAQGNFWDNAGSSESMQALGNHLGGETKISGYSADLTWDIDDELQFRSITAYRSMDRYNNQDTDGTPFTIVSAEFIADEDVFSQEFQLIGTGDGYSWLTGLYYSVQSGQEGGPAVSVPALITSNPAITDGDLDSDTKGIFGQMTYSLTDTVQATAGLRWSEETKELVSRSRNGLGCTVSPDFLDDPAVCVSRPFEDTFSDWSYLLSLDWSPIEHDVMFYAKTSRGFRGGGQNLRGSQPGTFDPFEPEVVTEYEVGAKSTLLDGSLRMNAALFTDEYEGAQRRTLVSLPAGGITTSISNAGEATIQGFELEATYLVSDALTLSLNAAWLDATYDKYMDGSMDRSDEVFPEPEYTYTAIASYLVPIGQDELKFVVNWAWQDDTQLDPRSGAAFTDTVSQEAYGLLGGRVVWSIANTDTEIALWGRNLTDKEYTVNAISFETLGLGFNTAYSGAPRTVGIEFIKRFGG